MKRIVRVLSITLLLLGALLLALRAACYLQAWRNQRAAEQALAVVKNFQPGVTTRTEITGLRRFGSFFVNDCGTDSDGRAYLQFMNMSHWELIFYHGPDWLREFEAKHFFPRGTMLMISIMCDAKVVRTVRVVEAQEDYSAITELLSPGIAANNEMVEKNASQEAYFVWSSGGPAYEGSKLLATMPDYRRLIHVTPEASPEERRRALDFHLDCFTRLSGCQSPNAILDPAPNR